MTKCVCHIPKQLEVLTVSMNLNHCSCKAKHASDTLMMLPVCVFVVHAVAFEAYLEPSGSEEQYREVLLNDTHVTYTDRCVSLM
jgi:hypothetical protein